MVYQDNKHITIGDYLNSKNTDISQLLEFVLKKSPAQLWLNLNHKINNTNKQKLNTLITKRNNGTPLAYITNNKDFYHLNFKVNQSVLIPRDDSELLVDIALKLHPNKQNINILELATGSGAIAIVIADKKPNWHIIAVDISIDALNIAKENQTITNTKNINFIHSDWFNKIVTKFDIIIANPPYIAANDEHLANLTYEPTIALVADNNGLSSLEYIIKNSPKYLNKDGYLLLEHGYTQQQVISKLLTNDFCNIQKFNDLSGNNRAVLAQISNTTISS